MKKNVLVLIFCFITTLPLIAQPNLAVLFQNEDEVIRRDAEKILKGYLTPLVDGTGYGIANGWNNTAKTHDKLGFDLTVTVNAARIPDTELFYDISALELERLSLEHVDFDNSAVSAPTLFGPKVPVQYRYTNGPVTYTFDGLTGIDMEEAVGANFVPVPMAQLTIGTIKNTDLKIRFVPEAGGEDYMFSMWGVGVMHDIKQYMPGIKSVPFDLSVFVGYTKMNFELNLEDPNNVVGDHPRGTFNNSTITGQALISKKLSVLTVYGGLGYNIINSTFSMLGTYYIEANDSSPAFTLTDPIKDMSFDAGGPRATAGFMLKFSVITLHADYTFQEYNTLSVGFGISVR